MPRIRLSNWTLIVLIIVPVIWTVDVLSGDGPAPGASPSEAQTYWGIFALRIVIAIAAGITLVRRGREEAAGRAAEFGSLGAPAGAVGFASAAATPASPTYGEPAVAGAAYAPTAPYVPQGIPPYAAQAPAAYTPQAAAAPQQAYAPQPGYAPQPAHPPQPAYAAHPAPPYAAYAAPPAYAAEPAIASHAAPLQHGVPQPHPYPQPPAHAQHQVYAPHTAAPQQAYAPPPQAYETPLAAPPIHARPHLQPSSAPLPPAGS